MQKVQIGDRFGKWTVLEPAPDKVFPSGQRQKRWLCRCDCGNTGVVQHSNLVNGFSKTCGCSMMKDLTGQRFGSLVVLGLDGHYGKRRHWRCVCDCGNEKVLSTNRLKQGTISCGCKKGQHGAKVKHKRLYRIFTGMKSRCYNPNATGYARWGGRGITICDEWRYDFFAFHDWAMANGYADGLTIDRIDNDGNYCPENCRWATKAEQNRNKSNVKKKEVA